jgi:hypothetical protein
MLPTSVPGYQRGRLQASSPSTAADAVSAVIQQLAAWGFPADDAAYALQGAVRWKELAPRQFLFTQDTAVTAIYLLVEGKIFQEQISEDSQGNRRVTLRRDSRASGSAIMICFLPSIMARAPAPLKPAA